MMRSYAMVAGFFAIFIHSMLIACIGFTGGGSSFAPSYIVSAILLISGTVLVLLHKRDMTVGQVLGYMNTINCLSYGSSSTLSEITKNCRRIFETFRLDVPESPLNGMEVCDLMELIEFKD